MSRVLAILETMEQPYLYRPPEDIHKALIDQGYNDTHINGVSMYHRTRVGKDRSAITTRFTHNDGEWNKKTIYHVEPNSAWNQIKPWDKDEHIGSNDSMRRQLRHTTFSPKAA